MTILFSLHHRPAFQIIWRARAVPTPMQMRTQAPRTSAVLCTLSALFLPNVASAQTPLEIEEAARQALINMERNLQETAGTAEASFPTLNQETDATEVPSEGYFFSDDEPRAFWRSQNGRRIVHPVTGPQYNDDAYITSDVRGYYINHQFPSNASGPTSGAARIYSAQFRYAVNESFQVQLNELGFRDVHLDTVDHHGSDNVSLAAKYAFLQDWESQTHASIGLGYKFRTGNQTQLAGDTEFRLFGAWNQGFDRSHIGVSINGLFSTGSEDAAGDSDRLSVHLHYDYEVNDTFSPIVELNYYKTLSNGDAVTPFSGLDLINFGGNEDEDALSAAIGGEVRFMRDLAVRGAYETPLTSNTDLWGDRWTASLVWRF